MHTKQRFCELTQKATGGESKVNTPFDGVITVDDSSRARIIALSEELSLDPTSLVQELMQTALGDAHEGFKAAYDHNEARLNADKRLKARVAELLKDDTLK